jgi:hypothetical protein
MNPYLEEPGIWPDLHGTLIIMIRSALNRVLPERYSALVDRHVWLYEPDAESRRLVGKPDDLVIESRPFAPTGPVAPAMLSAPAVRILPAVRREGVRYLPIRDRHSRQVVTVLEILSPSNKVAGEDREQYLGKRQDYLASGTNLVEIDLLRAGQRMPMGEPAAPVGDYYVLVSQAVSFPEIGIWPISVREPLPTFPLPLLPEDGSVPLALQQCYEAALEGARYDRELDYSKPPVPPLSEPDATWAREILAHRPV